MSRKARAKSESNIYHILARGIEGQPLFGDEEDFRKLLEILAKYKPVSGYELYAYCLMGNHFHLLLKTNGEGTDRVMKRVVGSYVYWFNRKYARKGPLFRDRYRSEPAGTDAGLLSALRHIHQNPVKAGLCKKASEYPYSSYRAYTKGDKTGLADCVAAADTMSRQEFAKFHEKSDAARFMDAEEKIRIPDSEAAKIIERISGSKTAAAFGTADRAPRAGFIREFRAAGLSLRQISRLTGLGVGAVRRK
ncbi:MAG: transposase [Clostridiales Family XIII bacterium]|jgi:REP element-mobilizing transposase RayT|nr:transposase [Clostridiales Family XIII bacterium]